MAKAVRPGGSRRLGGLVSAADHGRSLVVVPRGRVAFDAGQRIGRTQIGRQTVVVHTDGRRRRTTRALLRDRHQVLGLCHEPYQFGRTGNVSRRVGRSHYKKP